MAQTTDWGRIVRQALAAGIVAGILIAIYLYFTQDAPAHVSLAQHFQWVASAAFGQIAYTSAAYVALGILFHFAVSIGWAGGYAYLAQQQTFLNARWAISGIVFGLVVYVFMDLLLLGVRMFVPPPPIGIVNAVVAHCVFFGLPLGYVVSRTR